MGSYDNTEFVIGFAVKAALDKALGGAAPVVTGYHRFHFQLLARALQEASRDEDLQKTLESIRKNLTEMRDYGKRLLEKIPEKPEPPSTTPPELLDPVKNKAYSKRVAEFAKGVVNILAALRTWLDSATDVHKRTRAELAKIEKGLDMHASRWDALRKVSNVRRKQEIQFIELQEMEALSRQIGQVRTRLSAYERI